MRKQYSVISKSGAHFLKQRSPISRKASAWRRVAGSELANAAMTVFDASKKYAVRPSDSCGNKLTSHKWSSTLWRNEWGANQADSSQTAHMCQARRRVRSITALSQELVVRGMGRPMVYRAAPSWHPGQALASYPGSVRRVTARSSVLMPSSMSRRWPRLQPAHMHGVKERCPGAILPLRGERE